MLDAHPAPAVHAHSPDVVPPAAVVHTSAPRPEPRSKPVALLAAARSLLSTLEAGRALNAPAAT